MEAGIQHPFDLWCLVNIDTKIGLDHRDKHTFSSSAFTFTIHFVETYCRSVDEGFLRASILKSVANLLGKEEMQKCLQNATPLFASIASAMNFVQSNLPHFVNIRLDFFGDLLNWLLSTSHGVVLVRLEGRDTRGNIGGHAITMDVTERMFQDCAKEYEMQLFKVSFKSDIFFRK